MHARTSTIAQGNIQAHPKWLLLLLLLLLLLSPVHAMVRLRHSKLQQDLRVCERLCCIGFPRLAYIALIHTGIGHGRSIKPNSKAICSQHLRHSRGWQGPQHEGAARRICDVHLKHVASQPHTPSCSH